MRRPAIFLHTKKGEEALRTLRELGLGDRESSIRRSGSHLLIPLCREPSAKEIALLKERFGELKLQTAEFDKKTRTGPSDLRQYLKGKIPDETIENLTQSFDQIGDIAVIELPESLDQFSRVIGEGILEVNPHSRLVLRKSSTILGPYRTRKFQVLAGAGGTQTVHHEFNCRYSLDVSNVYFNPRLSHERMRVAKQVQPNERVVDMFAGVGTYSILCAKLQPQSVIYSVDLNPDAAKYLKENAFTNGVADRVITMQGDVSQLAKAELKGMANRVIMNLPSESTRYLAAASQILHEKQGTIHYYTFADRENSAETYGTVLTANLAKLKIKVKSIKFCKAIKEISPRKVQVAVDAIVEPA